MSVGAGQRLLIGGLITVAGFGCAYYGGIEETPSWQFTTHTHFGLSVEVRRAVLLGDLEGARAAGRRVEGHPAPANAPPGLLTRLAETRRAAAAVAEATTLDGAASAAAEMAASCGKCHAEGRVGPRYLLGDPPGPPTEDGHPEEYTWAMVRLWQALVASSDSAWTMGARTLQGLPITAATIARLGGSPAQAPFVAKEFLELADRAASSSSTEERVAIVAGLLTACGGCHQEVRSP